MSIKLITQVWDEATDLKNSKLVVMLAYADYANDEGIAWPKVKSIARRARISIRQARRIKQELQEAGYLEAIEKLNGRSAPDVVKVIPKRVTLVTERVSSATAERVTLVTEGVTPVTAERVTLMTGKGDTDDTSYIYNHQEPSNYEPPLEPSESSSSSDLDLESDQEAVEMHLDEDNDDFNFLVKMISENCQLPITEALKDQIQDMLSGHPASHIETAVKKAIEYGVPKMVYVRAILEDEARQRRGERRGDYVTDLPDEFKDIIIG
ncbi:MAG: helix-turn-helix domain-containing protein [Chloroflexota bacterium]